MSGPLPTTLYKVLPEMYSRRLVEEGEMMWSTLTWFQHEEDPDRGDASEGTRRYFPVSGLDVTRHERNGRPDFARFTLAGHGLVSRAAQSDHIFIFSTTLDSALTIGDSTNRSCVEVFDPVQFTERINDGLKRRRNARAETLIHDTVRYWSEEHPPEEVWALPDRLTMHKRRNYESQREYRFAFGTRADVFDFERVECFVVGPDLQWPRVSLDLQCHRMKLRLGTLTDCCRLL